VVIGWKRGTICQEIRTIYVNLGLHLTGKKEWEAVDVGNRE
jgi:hypothetical protein